MTHRRRLCVLGSAASPHVLARAQVLAERGYAVTLLSSVALPAWLTEAARGIAVRSCAGGEGPVARLRLAARTLRALRALPVDAYHAHYAAEYGTWLAALLGYRPLVVSVMGGDVLFDEQGSLGAFGRWLTRMALRRADLVTVKSPRLRAVVHGFGVPDSRIIEVVWGVDTARFRAEPSAIVAQRRAWGLTATGPVLFSPRMMRPLYRQQLMVEAMPAVLAEAPDAHLVVSRFGEDEVYAARLIKRARTLGVVDRVRMVPACAPAQMPASYGAADVVLSLPASDGLPQTVIEALACGTPVVAAHAAGLETLQERGESVLFAAPEPAAVAAAVLRLVSDRALVERLLGAGRRLVEERASLTAAAQLIDERLYALIDGVSG